MHSLSQCIFSPCHVPEASLAPGDMTVKKTDKVSIVRRLCVCVCLGSFLSLCEIGKRAIKNIF